MDYDTFIKTEKKRIYVFPGSSRKSVMRSCGSRNAGRRGYIAAVSAFAAALIVFATAVFQAGGVYGDGGNVMEASRDACMPESKEELRMRAEKYMKIKAYGYEKRFGNN